MGIQFTQLHHLGDKMMVSREDMIKAFTTPMSEETKKWIEQRSQFEEWLKTVIADHSNWNESVPLSMWQFSPHEVEKFNLAWQAWLAAKGITP